MKKELLHIMYIITVITILVEFLLVTVFFSTFFSQMLNISIEIIFGIEFLFAFFILLSSFVNKWKTGFSTVILCFVLFSLSMNINILSPLQQIEDYSILRVFKLKLFCDKYLLGLPLALPLLVINLFVSKGVSRIAEVSARFAKDTEHSKFLDIENRLTENEISSDKANKLKELIQTDINESEKLDGATKFLSGSIRLTIFVACINISIGILMGIFKSNLNFYDSLKATIPSFCMKIILITVPYIIVGMAIPIRTNSVGQTKTL